MVMDWIGGALLLIFVIALLFFINSLSFEQTLKNILYIIAFAFLGLFLVKAVRVT
jgi:hypothetical protein